LTWFSPATRDERLRELRPFADQARQMQGWDFAYDPAPLGLSPPWDYLGRAGELLPPGGTVLDMGTGGGELFAELTAGYSGRAVATEAWPPNVPVAARRLAPLGVRVLHANSLALPLATGSCSLVLNRHEELDPAEVARVLRPGGRVLTQQIHPDYHCELRAFFARIPETAPHHQDYPAGFAAAGMQLVDFREHNQPVAYRHLGELVYLLVAAPWTVPVFDLDDDLEALLKLELALGGPAGIVLSDQRYVLEALKPV
jgi:SAM-dependent methyltransferase